MTTITYRKRRSQARRALDNAIYGLILAGALFGGLTVGTAAAYMVNWIIL